MSLVETEMNDRPRNRFENCLVTAQPAASQEVLRSM
jgi:hypothetical protein